MGKKQSRVKEDITITRKVTKALPCKLTDAEMFQYGKDVGHAFAERERIKGEFDAVKQDYKGKIEEQSAQIGKLSGRLHSGIETRDVACIEVKNWTHGTFTVTRTDTDEIIESRPMREDEKQMEINGVVQEPDGDGEKK